MKKVILISGASAGIGKETAKVLAQNGYTVYGAARRVNKMEELKQFGVKTIAMDVTVDETMIKAVDEIVTAEGRIDVLINNAGFGSYGAIEDVSIEDAKYQLDVNVFGAARLIQLVLPHMRKNNYGKIVNISSIGGKMATPFGGWYHASKFALEGLSDSLRNEVKPFGIDVIVIEPGGVKSEWASISYENLRKNAQNPAYKKTIDAFSETLSNAQEKASEPVVIADLIQKAIEVKSPKTRYAAGLMAKPVLLFRKILSDKLMDKMIMSQLKRLNK